MKHFIVGAALLMFVSSLPVAATNDHSISLVPQPRVQKVVYMKAFGDTLPPIGYVNFCQEHRADCRPGPRFADRIQLTPAKFGQIEEVNTAVNTEIAPETDLDLYGKPEYWTYPTTKGDCEDYVLLKRRILIERGFPESTLLITVVRDENNEGHAVLTVRTGQGRLRSRQQAPRGHALGRHALHLHQASVGKESAGLDLPSAAGNGPANRGVSLEQPLAGVPTTLGPVIIPHPYPTHRAFTPAGLSKRPALFFKGLVSMC
jgi:predicted transglutaminase-like cysteine proteinase